MVSVRFITHFIALVVLISTADICLLLSLLIRPFSEDLAWRFASYTAEWFWAYMQNHWEGTLNAKSSLVITGDEIPAGESAVVISNHLSYSDYYLVQALASRAGMLGRCRYFVKREIVYQIPLFGWAFWALGMILVSRNWANDEKLIDSAFARIKENEHAAWIILYPEGTRRTDKKLIESQAFARKNGKNELQHLLFPRTKGFVSTIRGLRESHVKYLYDLTFLYTSPSANGLRVPSMGEQLSENDISKAGYGFRIHVKRSPIAELPIQEDELKTWCENRWAEKDALLSEMIEQYNPSHTAGKAVAEGTKKRR